MTSPAAEFLDLLAKGMWPDDPDATRLPDDAQISHRSKLLAWCKILANDGVPPYRTAVNFLRDGIWEYKIGSKRLTFFDTPGDGTYRAKARVEEWDPGHEDDFPWWPDFDEYVRLGHAFPKLGQKAGDDNLDEADAVREEDIAHDRP